MGEEVASEPGAIQCRNGSMSLEPEFMVASSETGFL